MSRFRLPFQRAEDKNGHALDGATLTFTDSGTSTPRDTFSDLGLTTANTNPVVADSQGQFGDIYLTAGISYRAELKDKNGVTQPDYPADNIASPALVGPIPSTVIADIATMRASIVNNGEAILLQYHTTAGDGGGGHFRGVTGAAPGTYIDDNGTIIVPAGGDGSAAWLRAYPAGQVSVAWFGLTEGGSVDCLSSVNSALATGAAIVSMPSGDYLLTGVIVVPIFQSLIGMGVSTVADNTGTTFLYNGTGEAIRSIGTKNITPFVKSEIANFRLRKITQASTLAAIALISGAGLNIHDIRIDTDSNAYNFKYGVVCDQIQISTLENIDVQGSITAGVSIVGIYLTNGPQYTAGNNTNFTNSVLIINCNINSCDYGIAHDGGEGFKIIGGNFNGAHIASMRFSGLNSFSIDTCYMEGSNGLADILFEQTALADGLNVGAGGGGTINNNRLASTTVNCIRFNNASIQSGGHNIYGNKFGSGRTGSAISVLSADSIIDSVVGTNVNLGGASKRYLDDSIYDNNNVLSVSHTAQLEAKRASTAPGVLYINKGNGLTGSITAANRIFVGDTYVVKDTDELLVLSNNSGLVFNIALPSGIEHDGRKLQCIQTLGTSDIVIGAYTLNAVGDTITIVYEHATTTWHLLSSIGV